MIKDVDLVSYLPQYLRNYNQETVAALQAENPEFKLVWEALDQILQNEFVETANALGLSRWEKILGIFPNATDTLENRRFRIMTRMIKMRPFTVSRLKNILQNLCEEDGYSVQVSGYVLTVRIGLTSRNNFNDIEALLQKISPANMVIDLSLAYNQHQSLIAMTHSQLAMMTHYEIRNEAMKEGSI